MPGPYGDLVAGRIILTTSIQPNNGPAVIATIDGEDDGPQEQAYMRQPLGIRARPRDKHVNAVVAQDGNIPEVMHAWDPQLTLPNIDPGHMQVHSVDDNPQLIDISGTRIGIGKSATDNQSAARKGDRTGKGKFIIVNNAGTGLSVSYTDATGKSTILFALTVTPMGGKILTPDPTGMPATTDIIEEIITGSDLVKIEGKSS